MPDRKLPKAVREAMTLDAEITFMGCTDREQAMHHVTLDRNLSIEQWLLRVYFAGMRAGVAEMVKATEWTPVVKSVRAEIRRREKAAR